jgi:hypothetical protein
MTLQAFQAAQAAMVLDAGTAARMAEADFGKLSDELTATERERLTSQARDPGMALSRKLHKGWRLTKLLTLLPMSFRVGDPDVLSDLVEEYWRLNLPNGLYFEAEAARFAIMVVEKAGHDTLLYDAASVEAARLVVGHSSAAAQSIVVHVHHDPAVLFRGDSQAPAGMFDVRVSAGTADQEIAVARCAGSCGVEQRAGAVARLTSALPKEAART